MSEEMKIGMLLAYESVKEEIWTIKKELANKGIDEPKGFSTLEGFIADNINKLK